MWAKTQREAADLMSAAWSQAVPDWRKALLEYKEDQSSPNPFEEPDPSTSVGLTCVTHQTNQLADDVLDRLKDQLSQEDVEQQRSGVTFSHEMTPAEFLQCALRVEAAQ